MNKQAKIAAHDARVSRATMLVAQLDYRRALVGLVSAGFIQQDIADAVGITQPTLSRALKIAQGSAAVREGFSGASVLEVCQRYTAGYLSQAQVIDELTRWRYEPRSKDPIDFFDIFAPDSPGSVEDLTSALDEGFLDDETYDLILDALQQAYLARSQADAGTSRPSN